MDFISKQIEISERLFNLMKDDHKQRMAEIQHWGAVMTSLMEKLEERDRLIEQLRRKLEGLKDE
jgi:predicted RNase H-like nuclease (RuvC/YqgF family)